MRNYNEYILLILLSLASSALSGESLANQWITETANSDIITSNSEDIWQGHHIYDDEDGVNADQGDSIQYGFEGLCEGMNANGGETAWSGHEWADATYADDVFEEEMKPLAFSELLFTDPSPMFYGAAMLAPGHIETPKIPMALNISMKNDSRVDLQRRLMNLADAKIAEQTYSLADAIDTPSKELLIQSRQHLNRIRLMADMVVL